MSGSEQEKHRTSGPYHEVVELVTKREGQYTVHATASAYSGSAAASPSDSEQRQLSLLQEALTEKELELMELKQQHLRLQSDTEQAHGNLEAALESKDRAIQQLEEALRSKERALDAMATRERTFQAQATATEAERRDHEHRMALLRAQVADANATMANLKARLEGDASMQTGPVPTTPPRMCDDAGPSPSFRAAQPVAYASSQAQMRGDRPGSAPHASDYRTHPGPWSGAEHASYAPSAIPSPAEVARDPRVRPPPGSAHGYHAAASHPGHPEAHPQHFQGSPHAQAGYATMAPSHHSPPGPHLAAQHQHHRASYSGAPHPSAAYAPHMPQQYIPQPQSRPSHQSRRPTGEPDVGRELQTNLSLTRQLLDEFRSRPSQPTSAGPGVESRLEDLLHEQEALVRRMAEEPRQPVNAMDQTTSYGAPDRFGPDGAQLGSCARDLSAPVAPEHGGVLDAVRGSEWKDRVSESQLIVLLERKAEAAGAKADFMTARAEVLEKDLQALDAERKDLRAAVAERDSAIHERDATLAERERMIQEMQASVDGMRARLAHLEGSLPCDSRDAAAEVQEAHEQMATEIGKLQRRLLNRDAAAKKYKDGCKALKAQLERLEESNTVLRKDKLQLERDLEDVKSRAAIAAVDGPDSQQMRELRALLNAAQDDVEDSRNQAAKADRDRKVLEEQVKELERELAVVHEQNEAAAKRSQRLLDEERAKLQKALQQQTMDLDSRMALHSQELAAAQARAEKAQQAAVDAEEKMVRKVTSAEEHARLADGRAADASAEVARLRQRLLAAEEATVKESRKIDMLERDVQAERQQASMLTEKLERARTRMQGLETQLTAAEERVSTVREDKRASEEALAEMSYKLSQAERRAAEEAQTVMALTERLDTAHERLRNSEARLADRERVTEAHEHHIKDWEMRLVEADRALTMSEAKVEEVRSKLQRAETDRDKLRETLLHTEGLIRQAKLEHQAELQAAAQAGATELHSLRDNVQELRIMAERERIARERAEGCVKEAHQALERHQKSMEASHQQGIQAATTIQTLREGVASRDATISDLKTQIAHLNEVRQRDLALVADRDAQLQTAQSRLAQLAPIMRRIASRAKA